jgi:hypothetical protein
MVGRGCHGKSRLAGAGNDGGRGGFGGGSHSAFQTTLNSEVSVKEHVEHVAQIGKQLGDEITIRRFVRFQVGESA